MHKSAKLEGVDDGLKQIEQNVKAQDKQYDRDRQRRASARRDTDGQGSSGFGATIRTIDVDGRRFNLRGNTGPATPGGTAPAPATGQ
jgi:hypothetical protein